LLRLFAHVRVFACIVGGLVTLWSGAGQAQSSVFSYRWNETPPADAITKADIREALVWTGHLNQLTKGDPNDVRQATQAWQKSKGHQPTDKLTDEQTKELIQQGLKARDSVGWSVMRDPAVGVAVGTPAKLVTFGAPRTDGSALVYQGSGGIHQALTVYHGFPTCRSMMALYAQLTSGATFRARLDGGFVARFNNGDSVSYLKVSCHSTGSLVSEMTVPVETLEKYPGLFSAMGLSLTFLRTPDPTLRPRPRVDELPLAPSGFSDEQVARAEPKPKPAKPYNIDESGTTSAMKIETRDGPDLRADEVFDKASGAVYVVKADRRLGSAVAISDNELLTNCHVVGDMPESRSSAPRPSFRPR
jgi:hypothetical protein